MEDTIILWMDLPIGEDYAFLPDCNILGLPKRFRDDPCAVNDIVTKFQADWRRTMLRVVS